jgi:hypothetical protein
MTTTACQLCRPFRVPRGGHSTEECEDAFAIDIFTGRFAVADGATESAQSGLWAKLLVEAFVKEEIAPGWPDWIIPLQRLWAENAQMPDPESMPWFLEGRYRDGAFATFLGLALDDFRWRALAIGDSCLFQVRDDELLVAFPLTQASDFDNTPWLVGSRLPTDDIPARQARRLEGEWRPGDRLYLMTDALSHWFLSSLESGNKPWLELDFLGGKNEQVFADWVAQLRSERVLKNDDTTLVVVCL